MPRLRPRLCPRPRILFVGINPSLRSAEVGHHFAGPGNPFWRLLHAAALVPEQFAGKLQKCAQIALEEFDGDLRPVLKLPFPKAKKALQKFPGIGEPSAEKILLFARTYPVLPLDSNGLRVLLRLGFGEEKKSYSTTYRLVQKDVQEGLDEDFAWLVQLHLLLRHHGQELCKRTKPECKKCPLAPECDYHQRGEA